MLARCIVAWLLQQLLGDCICPVMPVVWSASETMRRVLMGFLGGHWTCLPANEAARQLLLRSAGRARLSRYMKGCTVAVGVGATWRPSVAGLVRRLMRQGSSFEEKRCMHSGKCCAAGHRALPAQTSWQIQQPLGSACCKLPPQTCRAYVPAAAGGECCQGRRGQWWVRLSLDTEHLGRAEDALEVPNITAPPAPKCCAALLTPHPCTPSQALHVCINGLHWLLVLLSTGRRSAMVPPFPSGCSSQRQHWQTTG